MATTTVSKDGPVNLFRWEKAPEITFLLSFSVVVYLVINLLLGLVFNELGMMLFQKYNSWFSFGFWLLAVSHFLPYFLVSVPEVTSLITVNLFGGELKEYPTGIHFKYPWEQTKSGNYINLRIFAKEFEKGETYPALDGVMLHVVWSFQYRGMKGNIGKYIAVDKTVIDRGLHDIGSSFLAQIIANLTAETARKNIKRIEGCMKGHYEHELSLDLQMPATLPGGTEEEVRKKREKLVIKKIDEYLKSINALDKERREALERHEDPKLASYEEKYGIDLILVAISDVDYDPVFQQALSARETAKKIKETAKTLQEKGADGGKPITDAEAMEAALVVNKNTTKTIQHNVQEIRGEGMNAVANFLTSLFPKK
ncbi:MAG: hypothetical protein LiPW30_414 [Parcubacteria group bacterium LiPW_30]|nr:MAG: hypothetical protein LiPW30_414 [Parcubacteria group bacterium LiPW_30]